MRPALRLLSRLAALTALTSCAASDSGSPTGPLSGGTPSTTPVASAIVAMNSASDGYGSSSNTFAPSDVYIVRDGTVTWNNSTGITHNVTFSAASAPANIPSFASGSQERTFNTSGTFNYTCSLHAGMSGTVRVQ